MVGARDNANKFYAGPNPGEEVHVRVIISAAIYTPTDVYLSMIGSKALPRVLDSN